MAAIIEITIPKVKFLAGVAGIDVYVDGENLATLQFGGTITFDVEPGQRTVHFALKAIVDRQSKRLLVHAEDGHTVRVMGKYSRLWGNIKPRLV